MSALRRLAQALMDAHGAARLPAAAGAGALLGPAQSALAWCRRGLRHLWYGPADLPRVLKLEWQFVVARWLGIVLVAPALLLTDLPGRRLLAAYALLVVAALYNLGVQLLMQRHQALFARGYVTMIGDGLLVVGMLSVGGGFSSPFHYILYTAVVSAAMRYGRGPSLAMAVTFVTFDGLESLGRSQQLGATFALRSAFLCLTALYASYLREQAQRAEAALQERLRQANLLNAATAKLGASLEFEPVLHAIAEAASHLFGSTCVVLRASAGLGDGAAQLPLVVHRPDGTKAGSDGLVGELAVLCERDAAAEWWRRDGRELLRHEVLPSGQPALVLTLALPTRQISLATLAVAVSQWPATPALDPDMLDSFVERITLAIENASLYRTLASRSHDLQRAYADLALAHQELLSVDEMKTNFIANVSHELRTPLSSIRAFSELLLSYDDDPATQKEFIGIVNAESERLTRLVNDVLDISKIEAGQMDWHMADLDIGALVRDSARTYTPLIDKHQLSFVLDIEPDLPVVRGDRDRLHQVLGNLISNAVKFTPSGTITLRAARVGDEVHVSVSDTGIGIAPQDQERIFEKFQQVGEMLTDKPRGTGLGLAICRDIVQYHQGRLWVESAPGAGSTFTVALKAGAGAVAGEEEPALAAPRRPAQPEGAHGR